ncbi:MAG: class I SAM-dependent methyltransferase [Nitriliruptoraceae bacterium]
MADQRHRLSYRVRYALRHPERIRPFLRRSWRDLRFRLRGRRDHVSFYREVMRDDVAKSPELAVGSATHDRWLALGQLQYDYLVEHGLTATDDVLEIGCGNLRAGWRIIDHLEPGRYWGTDISPDVLLAANRTVQRYELQAKEPRLQLVDDLRFGWAPDQRFDLIHAHSVFSHCPLEVIEQCFAHVGRILRPDGRFDLTFNATAGREHHVLHEDYYYRPETLIALAGRYGLEARVMEDWAPRHKQAKLRVTHAG